MRFFATILSGLLLGALARPAWSGVTNPDISAIGQVLAGMTDAAGSPDQGEPILGLGESEIILEAYLNPFFKGWFTIAAGEEGFEMEEAYATMVNGLPWGLNLKAGKYRMGFGKLNPVHPHAYPFLGTPRAWATLMPGEEGFNETAVQASALLPTPGDWASVLAVDVFQGGSFHPDEERTRLGWLGRWSNSFLLGDKGALEAGISGASAVDNVEEDLRGYLSGADVKARLYLPKSSQLTFQAEGVWRKSHGLDSVTGSFSEERFGFYAFADFRYQTRYDAGLIYDQVGMDGEPSRADRAIKYFIGYAFLEESTVIRVSHGYFMPEAGEGVNTFSLQFLFSMGPHKPHQF